MVIWIKIQITETPSYTCSWFNKKLIWAVRRWFGNLV